MSKVPVSTKVFSLLEASAMHRQSAAEVQLLADIAEVSAALEAAKNMSASERAQVERMLEFAREMYALGLLRLGRRS